MVRRQLLTAALVAMAAVLIAQPGSSARGQEGGILRVVVSPFVYDHIDPALSYLPPGWSLLEATCARLYTYPDKASPAGFRLLPEVAAKYSRSPDLKTYTFTLRRGFRFSNGDPVPASAFARAINRVLDPMVQSPGAIFMDDIVGAKDVLAGRTERHVSRRPRVHPRRQVRAPGSELPRPNGAAVLLRGPALAAPVGRGHRQDPVGRPVLRQGVSRWGGHCHPAQPLLRRRPALSI